MTAGDGQRTWKYPSELPVSGFRDEIVSLLRTNQAVIVCGDTGSGKTTQLPKMALEAAGPGARGVACTQPRRLAAVSVASRVASELGEPVGGTVGWQHRFGRKTSAATRIKFMTDGVLLAETRSDPLLRSYGTIIVDEAHERNLNVDFLLGILKRILARRRDLRVVVSSATLDHEKFSAFFGGAPAVCVPGRLFPVETRYMAPPDGEEADLPREVAAALSTLPARDDTLVFLPGERDIRECAAHLERLFPGDAVIPLLASLPSGEAERAFKTLPQRRIVLATNVAETSLTIPGIKAVVDSGLARIPRYIHRTQVQRLQIEPVSQASAKQRAGRCGRIAPGTCIRLYSREDFEARPAYTPPEILRSSLAGVLLTMLDLGLGAIEEFPFIDPPRPANVREGYRELLELGAIRRETRPGPPRLTATGRKLARIPLEPRLAKMLLAASSLATLPSALPVVAAMGCDDPRRRPADERQKADAAHAQFRVAGSDFLGTLKLWRWWAENAAAMSQTKLRQLAKKTFLSYPKMREWAGIVRQLEELSRRLGLDAANDGGGPDALHKALMSGLLGRIGKYNQEDREYRGAHGTRFALHPAGVLAKKARKGPPEWVMAGELVDTSRLFARNAAEIDCRWIEPVARGVCKYSWHDPQWDPESGYVRVVERVTLYGLVLVEGRRRDFSGIDPAATRKLFLLHALVLGEYPRPPAAAKAVVEVAEAVRKRADTMRDSALFDPDALVDRLDSLLPAEILSTPALEKWLRTAPAKETARFRLDPAEWLPAGGGDDRLFPEKIEIGKAVLSLSYRNAPGEPDDGITCTVRKSDAAALALWRHDRLVPGRLPEKISVLLSSLPSSMRRAIGPVDDAVAILLPEIERTEGGLCDVLRRAVYARFGVRIGDGMLENARMPQHLSVRFVVVPDGGGRALCDTRDAREALAAAGVSSPGAAAGTAGGASVAARGGKRAAWDFGDIPPPSGGCVHALHDEGDGVALRLYRDRAAATAAHRDGLARLAFLAEGARLAKTASRAFSSLGFEAAVFFKSLNYPADAAANDLAFAALREEAVDRANPEKILSRNAFDAMLAAGWNAAAAGTASAASALAAALADAAAASSAASRLNPDSAADIAVQSAWLLFPGFLRAVPLDVVALYPRFFKAQKTRVERARVNPAGDRAKMARFAPFWEQYALAAAGKGARIHDRAAFVKYRWALEEYRISLFAQETKTLYPVSPERLAALWLAATSW